MRAPELRTAATCDRWRDGQFQALAGARRAVAVRLTHTAAYTVQTKVATARTHCLRDAWQMWLLRRRRRRQARDSVGETCYKGNGQVHRLERILKRDAATLERVPGLHHAPPELSRGLQSMASMWWGAEGLSAGRAAWTYRHAA